MKLIKLGMLSLALLAATTAECLDFGIGPFGLRFGETGSYADYRSSGNPFCYAIANQKQVSMVVESFEKVSDTEMKITTKRILIEPYVFGLSKEGRPILNGNVKEEKLVKEVTVKYGEPELGGDDDWNDASSEKKKRRGWRFWSSVDDHNFDVRKISDVQILQDTRFDAPSDFSKVIGDEIVQVICHVPRKTEATSTK